MSEQAASASPTVSVPSTAKPGAVGESTAVHAQNTAPLSVAVGALAGLQNAIFPAAAAMFGTGIGGFGIVIGLFVGAAIAIAGAVFSYLRWKRLTYTIGDQDIRVESGILSRTARSVPYERIQDVSLEQKLLPRLLGLVEVKFETGAGGGEDLSLAYLKNADGEVLREVVRERRDGVESPVSERGGELETTASASGEEAETLFSMGPKRLFTFGLFEFSLAVFAVLGGALQYLDSFVPFDFWDVDFWRGIASEQTDRIAGLGAYSQVLGAIAGFMAIIAIGSATGLARTFAREWEFRLTRTPRGFRRQRGLFTKTDVVMPMHRVQGLKIGTRFIRYRFGWHSLKFVSLAQDAGSSSHVVAPFAQLDELEPIVEAAGFRMPPSDANWHRATQAYRNVGIAGDVVLYAAAMAVAGGLTYAFARDWMAFAIGAVIVVAVLDVLASFVSWRFKRHALDAEQIIAVDGIFAPATQIATRVKLHSVEISQGPFARRFGYASLHLGLAGGEFEIPGIPLDRARDVRAKVLDTIAATDFSQLESQTG